MFPNVGLHTGLVSARGKEHKSAQERSHESQGEISPIAQIVRNQVLKMLQEPMETAIRFGGGFYVSLQRKGFQYEQKGSESFSNLHAMALPPND